MTKAQEQRLLEQVESLQKQVAALYIKIENNKLEKYAYSIAETAEILDKTPQAVYAMINRGELEVVKIGHKKVLGKSLRRKLGAD